VRSPPARILAGQDAGQDAPSKDAAEAIEVRYFRYFLPFCHERAVARDETSSYFRPVTQVAAIALEPVLRSPTMITGIWRRFGVHAFEGALSPDDMSRLESFGNVWHKKNPGHVVEMAIIFPSEARMESDARARMAKIIRRSEMMRRASATVILGRGLVGSMQRSVLTGLMMIAPPPHPIKVFGSITDAVVWLTPHIQAVCGADAKPQELNAAVDALCATFHAAEPAMPPAHPTRSHSRV
jgi:hypothetical protein